MADATSGAKSAPTGVRGPPGPTVLRFLSELVTGSPIPQLLTDFQGRTLAVSRGFVDSTGYTLPEVETGIDFMTKVRHMSLIDAGHAVLRYLDAFTAGPPYPQEEVEVFSKVGERRIWAFQLAAVVQGETGERYAITTALDITERRQMQAALANKQRLIERILSTNPNVLYVFDIQRNAPVFQNRHVAETLGFSAAEIDALGAAVIPRLAHPDDLPHLLSHFRRCAGLRDHELISIEYRMLHKDGSYRWFYGQDTAFQRDAAGRVVEIIGTATDITPQKQAEADLAASREALRVSEARYRAVIEDLPLLVCRFDTESRITFVNRAYARHFQKVPEDLEGMSFLSLIPESDRERVWANIERLTPAHPTMTLESAAIGVDGEVRQQRWTNGAVFDDKGNPIAYQTFGSDVTAEVRARAERDALFLRNDALVKALGEIVYDHHIKHDHVSWEGELEPILGYPVDEMGNDGASWRSRIHPEDLPRVDAEQQAMEAEHRAFELEYRFRERSGRYRWMHDRGLPFFAADGSLERVIGVLSDISERKRSEQQLQQAQKLDALGRLAGGIAHDLNNLLLPIEFSVDLCMRDASPAMRENLQPIREATQRAANLTRQILAFSRRQKMENKALRLNEVIESFADMLRRLIGEHIELALELSDDLPAIMGDRSQLEQVLLNLTLNARDAMPDGGRLSISTRTLAPPHLAPNLSRPSPGLDVVLEVSDTGGGIDDETRAHIFEPFFSTKERGEGAGLGLSTVHGIVEQHGGHVRVSSRPGLGTTFTASFPAVADGTSWAPPTLLEQPVLAGHERILVVEDDRLVGALVLNVLRRHGYDAELAQDAATALRLAQQSGSFDLLVTDVIMPRMDGAELYQQILRVLPGIQVLFMSGHTDGLLERRGVLAEGVALLAKPFSVRELLRQVRVLLDARAS